MKEIADYFCDLVAGDRFFGGESATHDGNMLARVAEPQSAATAQTTDLPQDRKPEPVQVRKPEPAVVIPIGKKTVDFNATSADAKPIAAGMGDKNDNARALAAHPNSASVSEKLSLIRAVVEGAPQEYDEGFEEDFDEDTIIYALEASLGDDQPVEDSLNLAVLDGANEIEGYDGTYEITLSDADNDDLITELAALELYFGQASEVTKPRRSLPKTDNVSIARILKKTNLALSDPKGCARRAAIAKMKAAVVATNNSLHDEASTNFAGARRAPLQLVASQRIG
jgi:hypothetical protein